MLLETKKKVVQSTWVRRLWRLIEEQVMWRIVWSFRVSERWSVLLELHLWLMKRKKLCVKNVSLEKWGSRMMVSDVELRNQLLRERLKMHFRKWSKWLDWALDYLYWCSFFEEHFWLTSCLLAKNCSRMRLFVSEADYILINLQGLCWKISLSWTSRPFWIQDTLRPAWVLTKWSNWPWKTFASYGVPEDLLVRSRAVSGLGLCGCPGRSTSVSALGSLRGDSADSQSRYSLPTVTSLIVASVSQGGPDTRQMSINEPSVSQSVNVDVVSDLKDVPPAVLLQREKLKKLKAKKECRFV